MPVWKARSLDIPQTNGANPDGADFTTNGGVQDHSALLLVESLMHFLVSKGVISRADFIEIVDDAGDAECELRGVQRLSPSDSNGSILYTLAAAFRRELGR